MGYEKLEGLDQEHLEESGRGHDRDGGHDDDKHRDYNKCKKERDEYKKERDEYKKERDVYKKERDEYKDERDDWKKLAWKYKKERDEYKAFVREALERLGVAVRKLDHLQDDLVDASKKIGKHHDHDKDDDKDHDHDKGRH